MPGATTVAELALAAAALLTTVLVLGVATVVRRGTRARCACFGAASGRPLGRAHLVRNAILLAMLVCGLVIGPLSHGSAGLGALVAAGAGALGALVFIRWDDLADLFAPLGPR